MAKKKRSGGGLDRARILEVAIRYADAHGIEKLNMRNLAKELGSPVMTLYTYIKNKDELLDGMVDSVAAELVIPENELPWRDAITEIATSAMKSFYRHAWVSSLWTVCASPAKLAHQESILRVLREAGFSVAVACKGYHAVTMHTIGFAIQALELPRNPQAMKEAAGNFLAQADPAAIPYFFEHVKYHQDHPESDGEFEFVLTMILDGLEKYLEET
ncbi:MAG: TetR/AcrR family transcriptional regulator [Pseudomonadota bacterium]